MEETTVSGHIQQNWPMVGLVEWDMLIEPYLNYPRITLKMLNERQKIC